MHFTISDFLLDLVQNSVEAGASRIELEVHEDDHEIRVSIADNGKGMDAATQKRVVDPFYTDGTKHRHRKVGLGIPFLIHALEQAGGTYSLVSAPGEGTTLGFSFPAGHLDTPPMGDLSGLFLAILCFDGDYELVIRRSHTGRSVNYELTRGELREVLGDFTDAGALILARQFLESQEA